MHATTTRRPGAWSRLAGWARGVLERLPSHFEGFDPEVMNLTWPL